MPGRPHGWRICQAEIFRFLERGLYRLSFGNDHFGLLKIGGVSALNSASSDQYQSADTKGDIDGYDLQSLFAQVRLTTQ